MTEANSITQQAKRSRFSFAEDEDPAAKLAPSNVEIDDKEDLTSPVAPTAGDGAAMRQTEFQTMMGKRVKGDINEARLSDHDREANALRKDQVAGARNIMARFMAPQPARPNWKDRLKEHEAKKQQDVAPGGDAAVASSAAADSAAKESQEGMSTPPATSGADAPAQNAASSSEDTPPPPPAAEGASSSDPAQAVASTEAAEAPAEEATTASSSPPVAGDPQASAPADESEPASGAVADAGNAGATPAPAVVTDDQGATEATQDVAAEASNS